MSWFPCQSSDNKTLITKQIQGDFNNKWAFYKGTQTNQVQTTGDLQDQGKNIHLDKYALEL